MDIYLKNETRRKEYDKCNRYEKLRDQAKSKTEKKRYQRKVDEWCEKMFCGKMGYFRVNYNPYSLSYWLQYNIDPEAKGEWGIEPFYSAIKGKKDRIITDVSFHKQLLKTANRWYEQALKLKDKESIISEDGDKLKPEETNYYIKWLEELVDFAELAAKTKAPIEVSA